jgi:hypothetical protein
MHPSHGVRGWRGHRLDARPRWVPLGSERESSSMPHRPCPRLSSGDRGAGVSSHQWNATASMRCHHPVPEHLLDGPYLFLPLSLFLPQPISCRSSLDPVAFSTTTHQNPPPDHTMDEWYEGDGIAANGFGRCTLHEGEDRALYGGVHGPARHVHTSQWEAKRGRDPHPAGVVHFIFRVAVWSNPLSRASARVHHTASRAHV